MKILDLVKLSIQKITRNLRDTVITVLIFVIVFSLGIFVLNFDFFVTRNMQNLSQFEENTGYMVGQTSDFKPTFVVENYEPIVAVSDENKLFNKNFAEVGVSFVSDGLFEKYSKQATKDNVIPILLNGRFGRSKFINDINAVRSYEEKQKEFSQYGYNAGRIFAGRDILKEFEKPFNLKFVTNLPVDQFSEDQIQNQKFLRELQNYKYEFQNTDYKLQLVNNIFLNITEIQAENEIATSEPLQLQPLVARISDKPKFRFTKDPSSKTNIYDIGKFDREYQYSLIKKGLNGLVFPSQSIQTARKEQLLYLFEIAQITTIILLVTLVIFLTFLYNKLSKSQYFVFRTQNLHFWDFVKLQTIYFGALTWASLCLGYIFAWAIYSQFSMPILTNLATLLFPMSDVLYFSSFGYFAPTVWQIGLLWIGILATILLVVGIKYKKVCSI